MRSLALAVLVSLFLPTVATAAPATRQAVVVLPPSASDADGDALALVLQSRASKLLAATGRYQHFHAKQILRVVDRERLGARELATAEGAALVARRLGVDRVIFGTLARRGATWTLTASAAAGGKVDPAVKPISIVLPAKLPQAIDAGAVALARLAAVRDGVRLAAPARPLSASAPALAAFVDCHATLMRQPFVLDAPVVLDPRQVERGLASCRAAVAADPRFQEARAALGLMLAIAGRDAEAVETLAAVKEGADFLPLYWLGRYWLVTRYQSVDAGATALRTAIEKHPYFLLAYGYLAAHEQLVHHDEAALAAWRRYGELLPANDFIHGRASRSLAALGRHAEAISEARAAVERDPTNREAALELASRHLESGNPEPAIAILRPLADEPGARAELLLRLGNAYARKGDVKNGELWLRRAEAAAATAPGEWRTRARARLDLAMLLVKGGRTDEGQRILVSSERGGLAGYIAAQQDEELKRAVRQAEVQQKGKTIEEFLFSPPTEQSPFIVDGAGAIISDRDPPPAPRMFEVLRF